MGKHLMRGVLVGEVMEPCEVDRDSALYFATASLFGRDMGTCTRRNVGAVLVVDGRIREVGWNGMELPGGARTCALGGCPRGQLSVEDQPHGSGYSNCVYLHAEFNVQRNYRESVGLRHAPAWAYGVGIFSSSVPCEDCLRYAQWSSAVIFWEVQE